MISQHKRDCIHNLDDEGVDVPQIARRLRMSERTVRQVLRGRYFVPDGVVKELDQIRQDNGLSMAELSQEAGYHVNQWTHVMTGKHNPSFLCVQNVAQALGVKLEVRTE